jgi:hypothetical protein
MVSGITPSTRIADSSVCPPYCDEGPKSTQTFTTAGNWDVAWTYDCAKFVGDTPGGHGNFIVITYDATTNQMATGINLINQLGVKDSGTDHFHAGGSYYLALQSECDWTVTVTG